MPAKKGSKHRKIVNGAKAIYKSKEHSEASIQRALSKFCREKKLKYFMSNIYFFHKWESDAFCQLPSGHLLEYEVKVDFLDYSRDVKTKPAKHKLLSDAFEDGNPKGFNLPHYFYYVAPQGMIDKDEIPPYTGLIEIVGEDTIKYTKVAPKIHDNIKDVDSIMLKKFYNKSLKMENLLIKFRIDLFKNPEDSDEIVRKFLKTMRF